MTDDDLYIVINRLLYDHPIGMTDDDIARAMLRRRIEIAIERRKKDHDGNQTDRVR